MLFRSNDLFLETEQYFGTSQNEIEDKKSGMEGVIRRTKKITVCNMYAFHLCLEF